MFNKIKIAAFLVFLIFAIRLAGDLDNSYIIDAKVLSYGNNELVFEDWQHKIWVYDINGDFKVEDTIKVKYHTNYTEHNREDDSIIWVKEID